MCATEDFIIDPNLAYFDTVPASDGWTHKYIGISVLVIKPASISVHLSTTGFSDSNEIWYVGKGR